MLSFGKDSELWRQRWAEREGSFALLRCNQTRKKKEDSLTILYRGGRKRKRGPGGKFVPVMFCALFRTRKKDALKPGGGRGKEGKEGNSIEIWGDGV